MSEPMTKLTRAGERERAVARHERLGDEERRREQHEQEAGPADREHLEPEEPDDQRDDADRPGQDRGPD